MYDFERQFDEDIALARQQSSLYAVLLDNIGPAGDFSDLLRTQLVYCVSAFDKMMHDMIRVLMVEIFQGRRSITAAFESDTINMKLHAALGSATIPPPEVLFSQAVRGKHAHMSFQQPEKVAQGLSLVWGETHKWHKIGAHLGLDQSAARTQLQLIVSRRNAIVHEADRDPATGVRQNISSADSNQATDFMEQCGKAIIALVT